VRVAAWGLCAIVAALALALRVSAQADEGSPFPSPSPESSAAPGSGGYAVIGVAALSANGGQLAASGPTATPSAFRAATASGYSIELMGRLSPSYISMLRFENANIHGDDSSVESRFDLSLMYQFPSRNTAVGIGYASLQRSTIQSSINGLGAGVALLPAFDHRISPYGSFFYYPGLTAPADQRGGLTVLRLGIAVTPQRTTGVFGRIGVMSQNFGAQSFSPTSLSGVEIGVGTDF
jgi:hypothetical protein